VLRSGPSEIYSQLGSYQKDSVISVLGLSLGNDWVEVEGPDGQKGWMAKRFLAIGGNWVEVVSPEGQQIVEFDGDIYTLPVRGLGDIPGLKIVGQVLDTNDQPIDGMDVAVSPQGDFDIRTDVYSDTTGFFYIYLPENSSGIWNVQIVGILCTSRIMDADCNIQGYEGLYTYENVTLPQAETIFFLYGVIDESVNDN
jgi:hypothetical protein